MFLNCLRYCDPHAGWEALGKQFEVTTSKCAHIANLTRLHSTMIMAGISVLDYISSLADMSQELEGAPGEVTERYLIMRICATLSEQFANNVDILKNQLIKPQTLNSISTILSEPETAGALRNMMTGSKLNLAVTSSNAPSANVNGGKYNRTNRNYKHR